MIVKMIQNLENKMEIQINRLKNESKRCLTINIIKCLTMTEELHNKQLAMNNTKTKIRNTLQGKFRVTEAEEWISVLTEWWK